MPLPAILQPAVLSVRRVGRVPFLLLTLWATVLLWGERRIWNQSAQTCAWQHWEQWPEHAQPHHVLLVADPQIVDPHTYPGRPWPLSSLTYWITDQYMRRSYNALLRNLQPHTTLFLGDLFDGGREWGTRRYVSPDDRFKGYDTSFWLQEYSRFMNLFVDGWYRNELHHIPSNEGRRLILSLPGNHDLGFAGGIDEFVKSRFDAHFGPLNRLDVLGNHTFVSVDTVSLSAMDQIDPATGSSGAGDGTGASTKLMEIWKPVESFLENARDLRSRAVRRRVDDLRVLSSTEADTLTPQVPSSLFPTVLLSHVPLFRNSDVICGPLRERGTSIPLSAGYQYQNVLTPSVSADIIKHLDADQVSMIYSGDDHDYCEVEHGEFTGRVKEITVKSTSMAMGVSRPGVLLVSLWNPVDMEAIVGGYAESRTPKDTIHNHLCLLPFQEGILMRYAQLLVLTIFVLAVRAKRYNPEEAMYDAWTLPIHSDDKSKRAATISSRKLTPPASPQFGPLDSYTTFTSSNGTRSRANGYGGDWDLNNHTNINIDSGITAPESNTHLGAYENLPPSSRSTSPANISSGMRTDDWGNPMNTAPSGQGSGKRHRRGISDPYPTLRSSYYRQNSFYSMMLSFANRTQDFIVNIVVQRRRSRKTEFTRTVLIVTGPALSFYLWLIWRG